MKIWETIKLILVLKCDFIIKKYDVSGIELTEFTNTFFFKNAVRANVYYLKIVCLYYKIINVGIECI